MDEKRERPDGEVDSTRLDLEETRLALARVQRRALRQRERFEALVESSSRQVEALARTRAELRRLRLTRGVRVETWLRKTVRRIPGVARLTKRSTPVAPAGPARARSDADVTPSPAGSPRVAIHIGPPTWAAAATWGDTEFARSLGRAFERRGWGVTIHTQEDRDTDSAVRADLALHVHGVSVPHVRPGQVTSLWVISHPDRATATLCRQYDVVFVASDVVATELGDRIEKPVYSLHQATDTDRFYPDASGPEHELLFVGNSRRVRRPIIDALADTPHDLAVYGSNWTPDLLNPRYLKGTWIPNDELRRYYSSAKIILSDHWADMRDEGFVSNRVYDALACGAFVLSDAVIGIDEEFDAGLATYENADDLRRLVDIYLADDGERRRRASRGHAAVLARHTFDQRVDTIIAVTTPLLLAPRVQLTSTTAAGTSVTDPASPGP